MMKKLAFDIYFAEDVYRNRWESWTNSLGYFCMNMTIKCTSIFGIEPVSYTHLDVYKRQMPGWFCRHLTEPKPL